MEPKETAERLIIRTIQKKSFPEELKDIEHNRPLNKRRRLHSLLPYKDNEGLMPVKSRVNFISSERFNKQPSIIYGKHPVVRLIITHYHEKFGHDNNNRVMNKICRAKSRTQVMEMLPNARMAYHECPFTHCGVYYRTHGSKYRTKKIKKMGCFITCLTTRAIRLEIAHSLSTDSAIMAIRRLIARRGELTKINYDNGTNFRGADKELRENLSQIDFQHQQQFCTTKGIQ